MNEITHDEFLSPNGTTFKVPCLGGPKLTVVNDPFETKGQICGLAIVTPKGYISARAPAHDYLINDVRYILSGKGDHTGFSKQANGFVTTAGEYMNRQVAGEWALLTGIIEPISSHQNSKSLYSYDMTGKFAEWPFGHV